MPRTRHVIKLSSTRLARAACQMSNVKCHTDITRLNSIGSLELTRRTSRTPERTVSAQFTHRTCAGFLGGTTSGASAPTPPSSTHLRPLVVRLQVRQKLQQSPCHSAAQFRDGVVSITHGYELRITFERMDPPTVSPQSLSDCVADKSSMTAMPHSGSQSSDHNISNCGFVDRPNVITPVGEK